MGRKKPPRGSRRATGGWRPPGRAAQANQLLRMQRERELARRKRARRWQAWLRWYILRPLRGLMAQWPLGRRLLHWLGGMGRADQANVPAREYNQQASD